MGRDVGGGGGGGDGLRLRRQDARLVGEIRVAGGGGKTMGAMMLCGGRRPFAAMLVFDLTDYGEPSARWLRGPCGAAAATAAAAGPWGVAPD